MKIYMIYIKPLKSMAHTKAPPKLIDILNIFEPKDLKDLIGVSGEMNSLIRPKQDLFIFDSVPGNMKNKVKLVLFLTDVCVSLIYKYKYNPKIEIAETDKSMLIELFNFKLNEKKFKSSLIPIYNKGYKTIISVYLNIDHGDETFEYFIDLYNGIKVGVDGISGKVDINITKENINEKCKKRFEIFSGLWEHFHDNSKDVEDDEESMTMLSLFTDSVCETFLNNIKEIKCMDKDNDEGIDDGGLINDFMTRKKIITESNVKYNIDFIKKVYELVSKQNLVTKVEKSNNSSPNGGSKRASSKPYKFRTVVELRVICKSRGIKIPARSKKADILNLLRR